MKGYLTLILVASLLLAGSLEAETGIDVKLDSPIGFTKLVNEISLYQNTDADFNGRGRTLQIISINTFKIFTEFNVEFTADFNWELDLYEAHDFYYELSLVKPIAGSLSLNYQQIHGTFVGGTIHQFGVRLSL